MSQSSSRSVILAAVENLALVVPQMGLGLGLGLGLGQTSFLVRLKLNDACLTPMPDNPALPYTHALSGLTLTLTLTLTGTSELASAMIFCGLSLWTLLPLP